MSNMVSKSSRARHRCQSPHCKIRRPDMRRMPPGPIKIEQEGVVVYTGNCGIVLSHCSVSWNRWVDMKVFLVKAVSEDAERLLEIQKICFTPHLERYQDYETSPATVPIERIRWLIQNENFYKVLLNGIWIGSTNIRKLDGNGNYKLHIINILPEYQGKGIGQSVIKLAENLFPDAKTWCLETLEDMPYNRRVYEKVGYIFTGKTESNDKLSLVFYKKVI